MPLCVFDLAESLGVEVRFCAASSFEGMFSKGCNTILVPSLRPPGRQAFAAGHELGHWYFGHGSRIDDVPEFLPSERTDPEEWLANLFSAYLLMTSWSVETSFARRGWEPESCTSIQFYTVACELGVGYETLTQHLRWSLGMITADRARSLSRFSPKLIRQELLGDIGTRHLVITDRHWAPNTIDLRVGDTVWLPRSALIEGDSIRVLDGRESECLVQGRKPGITRAFLPESDWSKFIRVCRADFEGRSIYRHLEDPDVD
jgi:hypothetical protein